MVLCYEFLKKKTMCVGIFLKFLHRIMIGFPIDILCNCMKCCNYLVLIEHNIYIFNTVNPRSSQNLTKSHTRGADYQCVPTYSLENDILRLTPGTFFYAQSSFLCPLCISTTHVT